MESVPYLLLRVVAFLLLFVIWIPVIIVSGCRHVCDPCDVFGGIGRDLKRVYIYLFAVLIGIGI